MKNFIYTVIFALLISTISFAQKSRKADTFDLVEETLTGRTDKQGRVIYAKAFENSMTTTEQTELISDELYHIEDIYANFRFVGKNEISYFPFTMLFQGSDKTLHSVEVKYEVKGNNLVVTSRIRQEQYNIPVGISYVFIIEYTKKQ